MEFTKKNQDFKHKILFFFMPDRVTFLSREKNDDETTESLKKISPYFYWCSAHEFKNIESTNKFLFQYQLYSIEDNEINPCEVIQKWFDNKNSIKIEIMNFIDLWGSHERIIINPKKNEEEANKNFISIPVDDFEGMDYFSKFASFVAKSILNLKDHYIAESQNQKFDVLQKRFWEIMAIHYKELFLRSVQDNKILKKKKPTKRKRNIKNKE